LCDNKAIFKDKKTFVLNFCLSENVKVFISGAIFKDIKIPCAELQALSHIAGINRRHDQTEGYLITLVTLFESPIARSYTALNNHKIPSKHLNRPHHKQLLP